MLSCLFYLTCVIIKTDWSGCSEIQLQRGSVERVQLVGDVLR